MTVGKAAATANAYLNVYRSTNYTGVAVYLQLHTGDPGSAGTANVSGMTTRNAVTFASPSGGSMALSSVSAFTMTGMEDITHGSLWTASTSGTFLESFAWDDAVPVIDGSTVTVDTLTLSFTPIAA